MSRALLALVVAVGAWCAAAAPAAAQAPDPIAIVLDASGSMADDDADGKTKRKKIDGAKLALLDFLSEVEPGTPVGLRQYPAPGGSDCNAGVPLAQLAPVDVTRLSALVRGVRPDGDTPTAEALRAAAKGLRAASPNGRGTLVLVSDGESTCDDPCEAAKEIAKQGLDLETITVGFRISDEGRDELECIADALDGTYVDADNGEDVSSAVSEASQPSLRVRVTQPRLEATADSPVRIEAEVANDARLDARDVVAALRLRSAGSKRGAGDFANPGVRRPVQRLGNLGPDVPSRRVAWTFRPGAALLRDGRRTLEFYVVVRASNARQPVEAKVTVDVTDATSADEAGPILKGRRLAILGDSFSAGEGADDYLPQTRTASNTCHRSPRTYLKATFDVPDGHLLACSGAVIADLDAPNEGNGVPAQREQLRDVMRDGIDAAVLTMSGNDVGFKGLAIACIVSVRSCENRVVDDTFEDYLIGTPIADFNLTGQQFLDQVIGNDNYVIDLQAALEGLHGTLNNERSFASRGRAAPILVLAYPIPVPITGRSCGPMFDTLSPSEIEFLVEVVTQLNAQVERAVLRARRYEHVPAYFVPNTETAFLPEHTVCDGQPYARALNSFDGVIPRGEAQTLPAEWQLEDELEERGTGKRPQSGKAKAGRAAAGVALEYAAAVVKQGVSEIAHPNADGYQAMTRAVLRWSNTPAAEQAADELRSVEPVDLLPTWTVSGDVSLDASRLQGGAPRLQPAEAYPLQAAGFAPQSPLTISLQSLPRLLRTARADADGRLETTIGIPPSAAAGDHDVVVEGRGRDGRPRTLRLAVEVQRPLRITPPLALAAAAVAAALLAAAAWGASVLLARRRPG